MADFRRWRIDTDQSSNKGLACPPGFDASGNREQVTAQVIMFLSENLPLPRVPPLPFNIRFLSCRPPSCPPACANSLQINCAVHINVVRVCHCLPPPASASVRDLFCFCVMCARMCALVVLPLGLSRGVVSRDILVPSLYFTRCACRGKLWPHHAAMRSTRW